MTLTDTRHPEAELTSAAQAYAAGSVVAPDVGDGIDPRFLIGVALERGWVGINLILDLTRVCNSRCATCGIWRDPSPDTLSLPDAELVFNRIARINQVYVTGGEPYLVPHLLEIATALSRRHPSAVWSGDTNALAPDTFDTVKRIRELGLVVRVGVSLEGDESTHDRLRGVPGNYRKAVELIRQLQADKIFVATSSLTAAGVDESRRLGLPSSRGIFRTGPRFETDGPCRTVHMRNCPGLKRWMVVTPTGDIYPCEEYAPVLRVGNIRDDWDSLAFSRVAKYIDSGRCGACGMHCYVGK
jgi:MoaA/NifB/PqqE/SkfB family radical SAM enzyme